MKNFNKIYKSYEIVKYYSKNRNKWSNFYKSEKKIIDQLNIHKDSTILDIGSACGGLGGALRKRYKIKSYTGVEINKDAYKFAKSRYKIFKFINSDILNYEKNKKKISKFNYVFSLGCVDWNFEINKMIKKAWQHVINEGYLVITLRLTNKSKFKSSYQYINFSSVKKGEKAFYQVLNIKDLYQKLIKFNISKIKSFGYWGKPNPTVITKHKKIFFIALALKKSSIKKKVNLNSLKKILF